MLQKTMKVWSAVCVGILCVACSSDSNSGGGDGDDTFTFGEWEFVSETSDTDSTYGDWSVRNAEGVRMRTVSTVTTTMRTEERSCTVVVNGDEDDPPLSCDNAVTEQTTTVPGEPVVTTQTDALDTAAWENVGQQSSVGGAETLLSSEPTSHALTFNSSGTNQGTVNLTSQVDNTYSIAELTVTQPQECTVVVVDVADEQAPTCSDNGMDGDMRDDIINTVDEQKETRQEAIAYEAIANPLKYAATDVTASAFADADDTDGYDIVNFEHNNADKLFLITNKSTATHTPTETGQGTACYDRNGNSPGNKCNQQDGEGVFPPEALDDTEISLISQNAYNNRYGTTHGADLYQAQWVDFLHGFNTAVYAYGAEPAIVIGHLKDLIPAHSGGAKVLSAVLPYITYLEVEPFYLQSGSNKTHDRSLVQPNEVLLVNDYGACGTSAPCKILADDAIIQVHNTPNSTDAEIVDDFYLVAGVAAMVYGKFHGLNADQIEDIIIATRNDNKTLNIANALSPVGKLR